MGSKANLPIVPVPPEVAATPEKTPPRRRKVVYGVTLVIGVAAMVFAGIKFVPSWFSKPPATIVEIPPPPAERTQFPVPSVRFMDVSDSAGITFAHYNGAFGKKLLPETMGGAVCVFDFDGDGLQDVLFVSGRPWPGQPKPQNLAPSSLTLYRNKGDGTYEDVTVASGLTVYMYGMGACAGDIDGDGFPDLFVTGIGGCRLFHNIPGPNGTRQFVDITNQAGITTRGVLPDSMGPDQFLTYDEPIDFCTTPTFVDYDGDGKLDLFICRYVKWSPKIDLQISSSLTGVGRAYLPPAQFEGSQCVLYRNLGGNKFKDVTVEAGIQVFDRVANAERPVAKSLGVCCCDVDGQGFPSLIVANDTVRNFFFQNVPNPKGGRMFVEKGFEANVAYPDDGKARGAMGIDWGEYLPGKHAAVIANFSNEPLTFLTMPNRSRARFINSALQVQLEGPSRAWLKFGTFFFDYDLDGRLDLFVCNGHLEPEIARIQSGQLYAQPAQLFWNTGDAAHVFEPVTGNDAGPDLFKPMVGRGAAYLDYNGDGNPDVIMVENNGRARLLRNEGGLGNRFIRLTLVGDGRTANTSAIGAQVTVEAGGKTYRREIASSKGYLSQSELPVTIGLGKTEAVDKVTVRWPGEHAGTQVWTKLKANTRYTLRQGKAEAEAGGAKVAAK